MKSKWWLAFALMCLLPTTLLAHDRGKCDQWWNWRDQNCKQQPSQPQSMPEGGSSAVYLIAAGATCLGAMLVRRRLAKAS
jgi:hypothetical protein